MDQGEGEERQDEELWPGGEGGEGGEEVGGVKGMVGYVEIVERKEPTRCVGYAFQTTEFLESYNCNSIVNTIYKLFT